MIFGTEGYWISPKGEVFEVTEHFSEIRETPGRFGFTAKEAAKWTRDDRELVLRQAIGKGWIRVRGHRGSTTFDVDELTGDAIFAIREHLTRIGAWETDAIKVHEVRHGRVHHDRAAWVLSGEALAAARNPERGARGER